jgi:hypothetical protein
MQGSVKRVARSTSTNHLRAGTTRCRSKDSGNFNDTGEMYMMGMRRLVGFLMAFMLAVFALPAVAHGSDENFTFIMSPASSASAPTSVTATLKNSVGDDDRIRSFKITAPAGVTVTSVNIPGVSISNISNISGVVSVRNVNISRGNSLVATLGVTFPAAGCGTNAYVWGASAWEYSNFSGDKYSMDGMSKLNTNFTGVCNYTLTVAPTSASMGATTAMSATFANPGTSTLPITTVTLNAPSNFSITSATPASGTVGTTLPAPSITISGLSIAPGSSLVVPMQVFVPCGQALSPNNWSSSAGAGFAPTGTTQSTTVTGTCSLSMIAPTSAAVNAEFSVTITLAGDPGTAPVTLQGSGCGAFTAGPTNAVGGTVTFAHLKFTTTGSACALSASAPNYSPASKSIPVFAIPAVGCSDLVGSPGNDGTVDPNLPSVANPNASAGQWGLRRGNNSDGTGCAAVNATFTLDTTNKVATLTYDKAAGGPAGVFKYTIVWPEVAVDPITMATASWTDFRPKVSWGTLNAPVVGTDDYVPALACADDLLSLGEGLLPTIPNVAPFNALSPITYPQYQPGQLARMCIAQHAWTSNQLLGGIIQVVYWDKVVDEGDGHVQGP